MRAYVLKRLLLMIPTLFGISLILWIVMAASPGRPGQKAQSFGEVNAVVDPAKERAKGESQRIFRRHFALDRPVFWNTWTDLREDEVMAAVETARASLERVGAQAKREARERLEDWGQYAVPALVRLLGTTTGEPQEAVLYWLRLNSVRLPEASHGRPLDAETIARHAEWSKENVRLLKYGWLPGAAEEQKRAVVKQWQDWFQEKRERWEWSTGDRWRLRLVDTQFATYWARLFRFDLGTSHVYKRPVADLIVERLPVSLALSGTAILLIYVLAVPLGIFSAVRPGTITDRTVTLGLFLLYSLPSFFVGTVLLRFFTIDDPVKWFPNSGIESPEARSWNTWERMGDVLWHATLPLVVLTYGGLASLSRYARSGMLDVIRSDYVRTARAKGMSEPVVVLRHAARNGMMPIVTLLGGILPGLVSGSIIVEYIFNVRGIGLLILEAINNKDYNIVVAETLLVAVLTQVGILLADVAYALLDPRISYS